MPHYGDLANLSFDLSAGSPVAYVWEIWDGQVRVTRSPQVQAVHSRASAAATLTVVDAHGQASKFTLSVSNIASPELASGRYGAAPKTLPYTVELSTVLADGVGVQWRTGAGAVLSTSNPYAYTVLAPDTRIRARVYLLADPAAYTEVELVLAGFENKAPTAVPISAGVRPAVWAIQYPVVRAATTANHGLSGLSAVDGVTPTAGARILVKQQTNPAQNGVYLAAAGSWSRSADPIMHGAVVLVQAGGQAGRSYVLILDQPDGYLSGDLVIFERLASSYDGVVQANGKLIVDCAAIELDGEVVDVAKNVLGDTTAASYLAHHRCLNRTVVDVSSVDLAGAASRLMSVQATWTDGNSTPLASQAKALLRVTAP